MLDGKIILVDDNEAVLKTLKMILAREFKTLVGVWSVRTDTFAGFVA